MDRRGAAWLVRCDSRWANEDSVAWGVIRNPDIETCQQLYAENEELG